MEIRIGTVSGKIDSVHIEAYGNDAATVLEKFLPKKEVAAPLAHLAPTNYNSSYERCVSELIAAVYSGSKIQAIKLVREMTGLGLKEAKDLVEDNTTVRHT